MFKDLFYLVGAFYIVYELLYIFNVRHMNLIEDKGDVIYRRTPSSSWGWRYKFIKRSQLVICVWFILGIFSDYNGFAFLLFLAYIFLISKPRFKKVKNTSEYNRWTWTDSLIGLLFGIFVILNAYEWKVSVYDFIFN
jgi:hypothetical protein